MKKLEDLKVGDFVYHRSNHSIGKEQITKITKTQIQTESGKYTRKQGRSIPYYEWGNSYIEPFTEEHEKILERSSLRNKIKEQSLKINSLMNILHKSVDNEQLKIVSKSLEESINILNKDIQWKKVDK